MGENGDQQKVDDDDGHDIVGSQGLLRGLELVTGAGDGHVDAAGYGAGFPQVVHQVALDDVQACFERNPVRRNDVERDGALTVKATDDVGVHCFLDARDGG